MKKFLVFACCVVLLSGVCFANDEVMIPVKVKIIKQSSSGKGLFTHLTVIDLDNNEVVVIAIIGWDKIKNKFVIRTGMFANPNDYK